ncbi:hypothetical protein HYH03_019224, partial [Edaphochlamys debaryana]
MSRLRQLAMKAAKPMTSGASMLPPENVFVLSAHSMQAVGEGVPGVQLQLEEERFVAAVLDAMIDDGYQYTPGSMAPAAAASAPGPGPGAEADPMTEAADLTPGTEPGRAWRRACRAAGAWRVPKALRRTSGPGASRQALGRVGRAQAGRARARWSRMGRGPIVAAPSVAGPISAGPSTAGPNGTGPSGTGPSGVDPNAAGPHLGGPQHGGPQRTAGPNGTGPSGTGPSGVDPNAAGPISAGPSTAVPFGLGGSGASPSTAGPSGAGPSGAGPSGAGPSAAGPSGPGPSRQRCGIRGGVSTPTRPCAARDSQSRCRRVEPVRPGGGPPAVRGLDDSVDPLLTAARADYRRCGLNLDPGRYNVAVVGLPGTGKTTLVQGLARLMSRRAGLAAPGGLPAVVKSAGGGLQTLMSCSVPGTALTLWDCPPPTPATAAAYSDQLHLAAFPMQ